MSSPGQEFTDPPSPPPPPPPRLNPLQQQVFQAALATVNAGNPPPQNPSVQPPQPAVVTTPIVGNLHAEVGAAALTIDALERFLNANGAWCYSGGYASLLWARHDRTPQVPTSDLDILVSPDRTEAILDAIYPPGHSRETSADGYKVTIHSGTDEMLKIRVPLGQAYVVPRERLNINYTMFDELLKVTKERSGGHTDTTDDTKWNRRRERAKALQQGMEQDKPAEPTQSPQPDVRPQDKQDDEEKEKETEEDDH